MSRTSAYAAAASFVVLGLSACSGSSGSTAVTDNPVVATSTSASAAGSAGPGGAPATPASSTAQASPHDTTVQPASSQPVSSQPATKAPGRPTGFARPGRYTYVLNGTATVPLRGTQQISGDQTFTVDPPAGSSQHSRQSDSQGTTDQTLAVRSTGLYMQDIRIANQGFNEEFRPVGSALFFPASYRTGSHWSWHAKSTDGKYTLDVSSRVASATRSAVVLDSTLHIAGNGFDIHVQQRDWISTTYALITKEHAVTSGTAYGAHVSSDVTRTLRSTTPS